MNAGQLCTKETLLEAGWPTTYVSDTVLKNCIARLRQALGDEPRAPRYIETVHGRGYRLLAPIGESERPHVDPGVPSVETAPSTTPPLPQTSDLSQVQPPVASTLREPEQRQLTVLSCGLVGSTALASQLDLEDYREVVQAYSETCAAVIIRFDGHITQYLGDGLLVYFGYPQAHEDDAQRAVLAGLELLEAMAAMSPSVPLPPGEHLSVRLGVHTETVVIDVVGTGAHQESLAMGETPNLAACLQSLADPNTLIISAATYALVEGCFRCQALGAHTLRSMARQMELFEVQGASRTQSRFEAIAARGLTPLVGRQEELGLLQHRWELATEGEGQVVLLSGEAGIGKSRLAETLRERLVDVPHLRLHYQCSPYHSNSAFYPFITQLEWMIQQGQEPLAAIPLERLEALLAQANVPIADNAPLLAALLSLTSGDPYPPIQLSPQRQKDKTILYAKSHQATQASAELVAAKALYKAMDMTFWLPETEILLAQVEAG
jgi:class 3 adenylate cyclase